MNHASSVPDGEQHDLIPAFAELALITVNVDAPEQALRRVEELAKQPSAASRTCR